MLLMQVVLTFAICEWFLPSRYMTYYTSIYIILIYLQGYILKGFMGDEMAEKIVSHMHFMVILIACKNIKSLF